MKSNRGFRSMWEWMKERPTTVEEPDKDLEGPQDLLSSKQIEKLKLEIENLRNKYKRIETFSPLFPLVATLVTMIALVLGFWQFQRQQRYLQEKTMSEQRYERTTRLQNQLRVDMDEIIGFTEDKSQTFSRAEFILNDMNIIFASAHTIADEQSAEAFAMSERNLTKILLKQIVDDPDFMNSPRGISFATTISKNFTGYRTYLQRSPETISIILHRYVGAMRGLRQENALYFNELLYDNTSETYLVPRVVEKREGEEKVFQHFLFIVDGFKEHMNLKSDQPELQSFKKEHIRAFEEALCNDSVARHLFGNDFIPSPCSTR